MPQKYNVIFVYTLSNILANNHSFTSLFKLLTQRMLDLTKVPGNTRIMNIILLQTKIHFYTYQHKDDGCTVHEHKNY